MDATLRKMADGPVTDVTQTKEQIVDGKPVSTKTIIKGIKGRDMAALVSQRDRSARKAIFGVRDEVADAPEIDRIVWRRAEPRLVPSEGLEEEEHRPEQPAA